MKSFPLLQGFSGRVRGLKVEVVDTTGAGDAFVAGILLQLSHDLSLLQVINSFTCLIWTGSSKIVAVLSWLESSLVALFLLELSTFSVSNLSQLFLVVFDSGRRTAERGSTVCECVRGLNREGERRNTGSSH